MKELVEFLAKNIVDDPKSVKVDEKPSDDGQLITLEVNPTDMGKIIGKSGKVIKAIRTLLKIKAIKENKKIYLRLLDESEPLIR